MNVAQRLATARCPCCGGAIAPYVVPREEIVGRLKTDSPVFLAIVRRLAWRPGSMVSTRELADYIWRYDPDGGPLDANRAIYNSITKHSPKLETLGWYIENCWSRWRLMMVGDRNG